MSKETTGPEFEVLTARPHTPSRYKILLIRSFLPFLFSCNINWSYLFLFSEIILPRDVFIEFIYFSFTGNSSSAILDGCGTMTLLRFGEEYVMTMPYAHCKG